MIPLEPCAIAKVTKMASRQEEAAPPTTTSETATSTSSSSSATESPSNNGRATDSVDAADAPQTPDDDGNEDSADARGFNLSGYRAHLPPGGGSHGGSPRHHPRDQLEFSTVTSMDAEQYDLSEGARIAVVFNHERFSNGLADRRGTQADCEVKT